MKPATEQLLADYAADFAHAAAHHAEPEKRSNTEQFLRNYYLKRLTTDLISDIIESKETDTEELLADANELLAEAVALLSRTNTTDLCGANCTRIVHAKVDKHFRPLGGRHETHHASDCPLKAFLDKVEK